ncbi:hypothetical protein [Hyphomonas sp.]|uniref:hypothetical protein n=1 Tax=Hyphomonas sp. TaxID=87 RepID=UPI001BCFEE29|nr:hypothetical protein [Hyphomonas sp.]
MSRFSQMMPMKTGAFTDPVSGVRENDSAILNEFSGQKLPVWLRLLTIVGLSAGLWGAIIWAFISIFG